MDPHDLHRDLHVNGVNGRLPVLLNYDIVCLQELKPSDEKFPADAIRQAGYGAIWHSQKSYNGVASSPEEGNRNVDAACLGIRTIRTAVIAVVPRRRQSDAVYFPESRHAYAEMLGNGWIDAVRRMHPEKGIYTTGTSPTAVATIEILVFGWIISW